MPLLSEKRKIGVVAGLINRLTSRHHPRCSHISQEVTYQVLLMRLAAHLYLEQRQSFWLGKELILVERAPSNESSVVEAENYPVLLLGYLSSFGPFLSMH